MKESHKLNLLLFGAPGSGKGTQSALLKDRYHFHHISTGDLFRKAQGSTLGLRAQAYMNRGELVPDSIVIDMIKVELVGQPHGFILDGFPRTQAQAIALDSLLRTLKIKLDRVLYLKVPEKVLIERLTGRRIAKQSGLVYHIQFHPPKKENICDKTGENLIQRKDDTIAVVQKRLKNYYKQTAPLIQYYQEQNILLELKGEDSSAEVFSQIQHSLNLNCLS